MKINIFMCLSTVAAMMMSAAAVPAEAPGNDGDIPVVFEANTDMMRFRDPTSRMLRGWQKNANSLFQGGFDATCGALDLYRADAVAARMGILSGFFAVGLVVNRAFSITAHDLGHMERADSIGASDYYLRRYSNGPRISVGRFFLEAFDFTDSPGVYYYSKAGRTDRDRAAVTGQGLNVNFQIASDYALKINRGRGHAADLAPYTLNKLWGISYFAAEGPEADARWYIASMEGQGYRGVTKNRVILLSAASFAASGGTLALARGAFGFIARGNAGVYPLEITSGDTTIHWPETTINLNDDNVSVDIMLDLKRGPGTWIRLGAEMPVLGNRDRDPEATMGFMRVAGPWTGGLEITTNLAGMPFFKGTMSYNVTGALSVGLEGFYGRGLTQRELREYPLGPGGVVFAKYEF